MLEALAGEGGVSPDRGEKVRRIYGNKFKTYDELLRWMRKYSYIFVDVPNWMRFLSHYNFVLGPRYHGVALGIQAGIPGTVVAIDSRTLELSKETGIKVVDISEFKEGEAHNVVDRCKWTEGDALRFDAHREEKAGIMLGFLESNNLEPSDHLISMQD